MESHVEPELLVIRRVRYFVLVLMPCYSEIADNAFAYGLGCLVYFHVGARLVFGVDYQIQVTLLYLVEEYEAVGLADLDSAERDSRERKCDSVLFVSGVSHTFTK